MAITQVFSYRITCDETACSTGIVLDGLANLEEAKAHADTDYGWYCGVDTYCHAHRVTRGLESVAGKKAQK